MSLFKVEEHTLTTSHIREYHRATAGDQEDELQLAVKQYTPLDNSSPKSGDVTIIGGHANGFPKELYEPLWDELYHKLKLTGISIRGIWIADVAHQGASGVLNEEKLGDDPSWNDHPRDLFLMINHFRHQIKRPIIGIGHSMGGCHLVNLSLMHPRLFTTLVLIDPVIQRLPSKKGNYGPAAASSRRRDIWPSRKDAEASFKRSKFYQTWDPRVLDLWLKHGLRDLPTLLYDESAKAPPSSRSSDSILPSTNADPSSSALPQPAAQVTLTTTKHQEVLTFLRANFATTSHPDPELSPDPLTHADVDSAAGPNAPFYRPEPIATFRRLPNLRPSVLYLFGSLSALSAPLLKADKLAHTGTGAGGSGGVRRGRVREVTFEGLGHLIPMEVVGETAGESCRWIAAELGIWEQGEEEMRRRVEGIPRAERGRMGKEFLKVMGSDWMGPPEEKKEKAKL